MYKSGEHEMPAWNEAEDAAATKEKGTEKDETLLGAVEQTRDRRMEKKKAVEEC